ncbi:MAG: iron-only hydrogenase system regulator [Alphaproteobacteria bacterium]|jgi:putative iron-only hydrogenase system regulator|nr:iron-only hydrogenase system regulator [Alphaproteobacteria bacterium]
MTDQIANIGILVKDFSKVSEINAILHTYSDNILSRSGMPYREKNVRLINVTLESSPQIVTELNAKLSAIQGVNSQIMIFEL